MRRGHGLAGRLYDVSPGTKVWYVAGEQTGPRCPFSPPPWEVCMALISLHRVMRVPVVGSPMMGVTSGLIEDVDLVINVFKSGAHVVVVRLIGVGF